jgi:DUF4097 and DUF4098 domain-containing protein YvlB
MHRAVPVTAALTALALTVVAARATAQPRSRSSVRSGDLGCSDSWSGDRASHCEIREETIPGVNPVDIDAGSNGGIRVRGSDRADVLVRARVVGYASTEADARQIVSAVRVITAGGGVHAEGPDVGRSEHWSVSFELEVPRTALLTLHTRNGGISIDDFQGAAEFHARNGGVSLRNVSGDIHGETSNGGVSIELQGDTWYGAGLDVRTHNGGIRLAVPERYSAELETGTTNGGISIDFPVTVQGRIGRHFNTTLGTGGAKIRAITTNGGVSIRQQP